MARNHCLNTLLVTALCALSCMSSLKPKPPSALSTGGIALGLCGSAHPAGMWQPEEAPVLVCVYLFLAQTKNYKGKSEFLLSQVWLKPPESLPG